MTRRKHSGFRASIPVTSLGHPPTSNDNNWNVLIIDDDNRLQSIAHSALDGTHFRGRTLQLLSTRSTSQAFELLEQQPDIAVCLLNMRPQHQPNALIFMDQARHQLNLSALRIIACIKQASQLPEKNTFIDYDINECLTTKQLGEAKLFSSVISAVRHYDSLQQLEHTRKGLRTAIQCSDNMLQIDDIQPFASAVLQQLALFLQCDANGVLCLQSSEVYDLAAAGTEQVILPCGTFRTLAWVGNCGGCNNLLQRFPELGTRLCLAATSGQPQTLPTCTIIPLKTLRLDGLVLLLHKPQTLLEEDIQLINLLTQKAATGMDNVIYHAQMASAEHAANTDYLTGLNNRRQLIRNGLPIWAAAKRSGKPLALAMIDIDHFKDINDKYGHDLGDEVLCTIADTLSQRARASDLLARYGGEEFIILAQDTDASQAQLFFNDIRETISHTPICIRGQTLSLAVSIGVTCQLHEGLEAMIKAADTMLYQAKSSGRNCVIIEDSGQAPIDSPD